MTTLYVEPFGGMAGDMLLAALLDISDPRFRLDDLRALAEALVPGEARIDQEEVKRGGLRGTLLRVRTPETESPPHRHLADLERLLERAPLSEAARERTAAGLRRIAEAEARVHGAAVEEIHFHEVGAVDVLVDVGGAVLALERLGVERVLATPPITGTGTVRCAHGLLPVPAPGTAEILRGLPHSIDGGEGERLTPTGAALLAELVDSFEPPGGFRASAIGYGAGARSGEGGPPNLVRVQLGEESEPTGVGTAWLMEFNLDDLSGERVGFCVQELRAAGALEVWSAPCQMKKDRPGVIVSALCREELRERLESIAFAHTPTLGVRWLRTRRTECRRRTIEVELSGETVRVVLREPPVPGLAVEISPEHDDLAALARKRNRPLAELERRARAAARALLREP